jgi:hemin uptake protein HemP
MNAIPTPPDSRAASSESSPPSTVLTTEHLFGQSREIAILHQGETYRLRITKNDKLILTK